MKRVLIYLCLNIFLTDLLAQDFTLKWETDSKNFKNFKEMTLEDISKSSYLSLAKTLKESQLKISEDQSKVLQVLNLNEDQEDEHVRLDIQVKDTSLAVIKKLKEVVLPYASKYVKIMDIFISNDSMIYICASIREATKSIRTSDNFSYNLKVYRIDPSTEVIDEFLLNPNGKYINEARLSLGKDNLLRGYGLYSNDGRGGLMSFYRHVHGYFAFEISKFSKEMKFKYINQWTNRFVDKIGGKVGGKISLLRNLGIGPTFRIQNVWQKNDGGCAVVLESFVTFEYHHRGFTRDWSSGTYLSAGNNSGTTVYLQRRDPGSDYTTTANMYCDLIILNYDSIGNVRSYAQIRKRQKVAGNINLCSIYATYYKNKIYILFNDHQENVVNEDFKKHMNGPEVAQLVLLKVNEDGTYTKRAVTKGYYTSGVNVSVLDTIKISDNEAIIFDYGGTKRYVTKGHLIIH